MKKVFAVILMLVAGSVFFGCSQRKVVQPEAQQQQPAVSPEETKKKAPIRPEEKIAAEKITEQQLAKVETRDIEAPKYIEEKGVFEDIYFDFDRYDIRSDAKPVLEKIASWLLKNTSEKILIEGHCDERGTNEYNLALGDRRAKATKDFLIALGLSPKRIEIISYGEEKPLCTEKTEDCWQKNRRDHFVVLRETGK
ncbi:MAG: peptidoglycan-associated lipoprotein Pal [Nitrospirota bacterium]